MNIVQTRVSTLTPTLTLIFFAPLSISFRYADPLELGGAYWSANIFMNQLFCLISVYIYGLYSDDYIMRVDALNNLWLLVLGLLLVSMLSFAGFLKFINQDYLWTFGDTQTGKSFVVANFENATDDRIRFDIFTHHRRYYDQISDRLKVWLELNWATWEENKPDWFVSVQDFVFNIRPEFIISRQRLTPIHIPSYLYPRRLLLLYQLFQRTFYRSRF